MRFSAIAPLALLLAACAKTKPAGDTTAAAGTPAPAQATTAAGATAAAGAAGPAGATTGARGGQTTAPSRPAAGTRTRTRRDTLKRTTRDTTILGRDSVIRTDPRDPRRQIPPKPPNAERG